MPKRGECCCPIRFQNSKNRLMLITHLFSQNNKVLALSSNTIFPKSPNISPLEPARIKEIPFDRGKQTQPQPAGRKHERADGQSWRLFTAQARRRRRETSVFANDFQKARLSFPPFCWRHPHDERPLAQSGASLQATGDLHDCVR